VVVSGLGVLGFAVYRFTREEYVAARTKPTAPAPVPQPPVVEPWRPHEPWRQPEVRPQPAPLPGEPPANSNAVIARFLMADLQFTTNSHYGGGAYPVSSLFDGNMQNAWYSNSGDGATRARQPWVMVTFPQDVTVRRVTVYGTRDPGWQSGYRVKGGRIELLTAAGEVLASADPPPAGVKCDFDYTAPKPIPRVRSVRFTVTADEGGYDALTEMMVE
jgi:F5/8 type C domain